MGERRAKLAAPDRLIPSMLWAMERRAASSLPQSSMVCTAQSSRARSFATRQVVRELSVEHREKPSGRRSGRIVRGRGRSRDASPVPPILVGHQRRAPGEPGGRARCDRAPGRGQAARACASPSQVGDRLAIGARCDRLLAGLAPVADRAPGIARLGAVVGQQLGLRRRPGTPLRACVGNAGVERWRAALEQALVGGVPHQRVLEAVGRVRRRRRARKTSSAATSWSSAASARGSGSRRQRRQQRVVELAADARRAICATSLTGGQPVEPGHQRVVQRGRDRQRGSGPSSS